MPIAIEPEIGKDFCANDVRDVFRWEELDTLTVYRDGVVVLYRSLKALTEDVTDINGGLQWSPCRDRFSWLDTEAFSVSGDEAVVEVSGGVAHIGDAPECQFGNESALEGAIDSFGSAAGLR